MNTSRRKSENLCLRPKGNSNRYSVTTSTCGQPLNSSCHKAIFTEDLPYSHFKPFKACSLSMNACIFDIPLRPFFLHCSLFLATFCSLKQYFRWETVKNPLKRSFSAPTSFDLAGFLKIKATTRCCPHGSISLLCVDTLTEYLFNNDNKEICANCATGRLLDFTISFPQLHTCFSRRPSARLSPMRFGSSYLFT